MQTCTLCSHENRVEKILNMRKDGKTGWIVCESCKSYINIRDLLQFSCIFLDGHPASCLQTACPGSLPSRLRCPSSCLRASSPPACLQTPPALAPDGRSASTLDILLPASRLPVLAPCPAPAAVCRASSPPALAPDIAAAASKSSCGEIMKILCFCFVNVQD